MPDEKPPPGSPEAWAKLTAETNLRDQAVATGRPVGPRKVSKRKMRGDQIKIAAALGTGAAIREVAAEVGLSKTMVQYVKDKIADGKDKHLAEVMRRSREELATDAIDVLKLNIARQKEALNGIPLVDKEGAAVLDAKGKPVTVPPRLSDMAQSARALNEIAFPMQEVAVPVATVADMSKVTGAVAAELLIRLQQHEEKTGRPEVEVDGERVG